MLVYTIKELCRTCYTCVRECPAKAIRIVGGQAEVIDERCIACGNCTKVCSQGAKVFLNTTDRVIKLLETKKDTVAIVAPSFPAEFQGALKEFEAGLIRNQHMELLCCEGCIMGPGLSKNGKQYNRRVLVSSYANIKMKEIDIDSWQKAFNEYSQLDLSFRHRPEDIRAEVTDEKEINEVLASMGKTTKKDQLDCGACGYESCVEHAFAIKKGLAEVEMCLPYTIEKLHKSVQDLALSNEKLSSMRQALKQSEKLAHMGQLSAGIAHELNNPLGVVIMYSNILLDEATAEDPVREDLKLIVEQAGRCKKIVAGLLNFARKNQVNHQLISIRELADHSLESVIVPEKVKITISDKTTNPDAMLDNEQMTQVLTNLVKNAIDAMPDGGSIDIILEDTLGDVVIRVKDTGTGIKDEDKAKIFEPFFTTKGIGHGTGLGLATAYGIVKMHKGQISIESNTDLSKGPTGTSFKIILPRRKE